MTTSERKRKKMPTKKAADAQAPAPGVARLPPSAGAGKGTLAALEDEMFERIHEAVLDHRLPPGTKLKETALAGLFAVNRNIVRKVLARLAHFKLVELRPNRGAVVASPSVEESLDLFAARRTIEGAIIDCITHRVTPAQLRELRVLVKQEQEAYRRGEVRTGLKLSIQFHQALAEMAGNSVLADFLDQLIARTPLVLLAYRGPARDASCSNDEHSQILEAVAAGDANRAVAAMKAHLQSLESHLNLREEEQSTDLTEIFGLRGR